MKETRYRAEASNDAGRQIEAGGFSDGSEAQRWAADALPDANRLVIRTPQGQTRGWYERPGGIGPWLDRDIWGKSR